MMIRFVPLLLLCFSCSNNEEKIQPKLTSITESVYSSVIIQPDSLYQAHAAVNGILENNLVEEGDLVDRGAALAQIININPKINAENARLTVELAENNFSGRTALLNSIREEINTATLKLAHDSINYFRQKNLWEQQIGSKLEFDTRKLNYQLSKNALVQLRDNYGRTQDELQTQLKQAKNSYTTSLVNSKDFTVTSKINGKIYALYKNPGEVVNTLEPVALVGSAVLFQIEMLVDEVDIVKIIKGQEVLVVLDAYNDVVFNAEVTRIFPKKDERNQTFVVEAQFDNPPAILYPGLAGEANIIIAQKKEAAIIPKTFLIDGNSIRTENGIIEIELGLQSLDSVEVVSGIDSSTWIYKPDS